MTAIAGASRDTRVTGAIARAAANSGVRFDYLYNQAKIESGLDPAAHARTSSASGLFQFTRQTWLATLKRHGAANDLAWAADAIVRAPDRSYGVADPSLREAIFGLRDQPEAASAMAAGLASDNEAYLAGELGREVEPVDLYLAHFLGPEGAARFLRAHRADPSAAAAPLLPEAAQANRSIFYASDGSPRSLDQIRVRFADRLQGAAPQVRSRAVDLASSAPDRTKSAFAGPAAIRAIEPMPQRLSLDFARRAYQRLASVGAVTAS